VNRAKSQVQHLVLLLCLLLPGPLLAADGSITCLTWNALADTARKEIRIPALFSAISAADADIVALQEVTPWFYADLEAAGFFTHYRPAPGDETSPAPGGLLIAVKGRIKASHRERLPGRGRELLVVQAEVRGHEWGIATCHLDSYLEDGPIRAQQLDIFFAALQAHEHALLLGDFNFGDGEEPETGHLDPAFVDVWTALLPHQPGFTWDIERSVMAREGSFVGEPSRRLDRILVKSPTFRARGVNIIGMTALTADGLFPSDHFGLTAALMAPSTQSTAP
jgi:endonuclease/exonuclease/phosphatase family metal-dependent hydrolase